MASGDSNHNSGSGNPFSDHRFIFIQLLFSLAVAEVARQTANIYLKHGICEPSTWPSYTHLLLALVVIATSWLGWRFSKRNQVIQLNSVFTSAFWVLILDVLCVMAYFVLTRGVEGGDQDTAPSIKPSARHEVEWVLVVFVLYALWDILTKAASHGDGWHASLGRLMSPVYLRRGWVSLACLLMALFSWRLLRGVSSVQAVIWADVALILLVVTFRRLKEVPANQSTECVPRRSLGWGMCVFVLWVAATAVARQLDTPVPRSSTARPTSSSPATSTKPVVYIASPYSKGDPAINTHVQCQVFDQLMADGLVWPVAPLWSHFQHTLFPRAYKDWIAYDSALLPRYDACLRLNAELRDLNYSTSESSGADREVAEFKRLGKPVFYSVDALYAWTRDPQRRNH